MRPLIATPAKVLAVSLTALALLAGCDGDRSVRISASGSGDEPKGVLKVVDTLQCPDSMGELTRKGSAQPDGKACTYTGPRGTEVSLHLVALGERSPEQVLRTFETELGGAMPMTMARMSADAAREQAESARAEADAARSEADAARVEAQAGAQAGARADAGDTAHVSAPGLRVDATDDRASVHMPGIHIEADGDKADVRIAGFTISADGEGASTTTRVDGDAGGQAVSINARDDSAEIRTRAPGDATRQTYLLTDETPSPAGWRMVGYEARGPQGGPIVVATIRAKDRDADDAFDDAKNLVTLNVGE